VGNPELAGALAKVKSFVDTGQFMAVQAAGVAAIESYDDFVPGNVAVFQERRDAAVAAFRAAGFACDVPRATMYLWIPLPEGVPSALFADRLMEDEGVVVLPGSASARAARASSASRSSRRRPASRRPPCARGACWRDSRAPSDARPASVRRRRRLARPAHRAGRGARARR
jgi:aspartate/methionine/tyrosine aminotransferase